MALRSSYIPIQPLSHSSHRHTFPLLPTAPPTPHTFPLLSTAPPTPTPPPPTPSQLPLPRPPHLPQLHPPLNSLPPPLPHTHFLSPLTLLNQSHTPTSTHSSFPSYFPPSHSLSFSHLLTSYKSPWGPSLAQLGWVRCSHDGSCTGDLYQLRGTEGHILIKAARRWGWPYRRGRPEARRAVRARHLQSKYINYWRCGLAIFLLR